MYCVLKSTTRVNTGIETLISQKEGQLIVREVYKISLRQGWFKAGV
jgi:hypothetical protein